MSFAQDLRASVLQAAMQGKLTEQLETDTSVSELLANIKAEKDRLIAEKKIKKEKTLSAILIAFSPEILTTPIPPGALPVEIAATVLIFLHLLYFFLNL